jgi:hypothetical protein
VRREVTSGAVRELMVELARSAPAGEVFRVYIVGGGTAVLAGWRASTIDVDLHADRDAVFRDIQAIKERLDLNIEYARPEQFVPPLAGSERRHVFIDRVGDVEFFHYDPYAQLLSKIVRGFRQDVLDARSFLQSGMVDAGEFRTLVHQIPESAFAKYPSLSHDAVISAVDDFLSNVG